MHISDAVKEANAAKRYEDKLTHIDNALRVHGLPDDAKVRECQGTDGTSSISKAAFHAPDFTRQAMRTIARLEYELERQ